MNKIAAGMVTFISILSASFFLIDWLGLFSIDTCTTSLTLFCYLSHALLIITFAVAFHFKQVTKFDILFVWIGCSTFLWGSETFLFYRIIKYGSVTMIEPNLLIAKLELIMCFVLSLLGIYFFYEGVMIHEGEKNG